MKDANGTSSEASVPGVRAKRLIIGAAVLHTLLLALYVVPSAWVPQRLSFWSQAYTKPLWHQQWTLFAPDPPVCSAKILVILDDADHRPIDAAFHHYAMRRMANSIARYTAQERANGALTTSPMLLLAMHNMVRDIGREVPDLQFELVESCVSDPAHPELRTERVTPLSDEVKH